MALSLLLTGTGKDKIRHCNKDRLLNDKAHNVYLNWLVQY